MRRHEESALWNVRKRSPVLAPVCSGRVYIQESFRARYIGFDPVGGRVGGWRGAPKGVPWLYPRFLSVPRAPAFQAEVPQSREAVSDLVGQGEETGIGGEGTLTREDSRGVEDLDVGRLVTQIEDEEFWEEVLRREPLLIGISSGETDR
jgi:hypothetical protein